VAIQGIQRLALGQAPERSLQAKPPAEDPQTMQQEKLVLPKFTVPGQRNWMPLALAGVGGLVVVSVIAFGTVVWKNKNAPVAAAAPVSAKVAEATPAPAPAAAAQPRQALAAMATPPADVAKGEAPAVRPAKAHRSHHAHGSKLARAGAAPHARSSGKNDAIDELLKKFK
jgi:hypothetical protein